MAGTFEAYEDKVGKLRFRLMAGNGEIVAVEAGNLARSARGIRVDVSPRIPSNRQAKRGLSS